MHLKVLAPSLQVQDHVHLQPEHPEEGELHRKQHATRTAAEALGVPSRLEASATAPAEMLARMPRRLTNLVNFSTILSLIAISFRDVMLKLGPLPAAQPVRAMNGHATLHKAPDQKGGSIRYVF